MSACVSLNAVSIDCRAEMQNVAVLPVPDCACRNCQVKDFEQSVARSHLCNDIAATNDGVDGALLDG